MGHNTVFTKFTKPKCLRRDRHVSFRTYIPIYRLIQYSFASRPGNNNHLPVILQSGPKKKENKLRKNNRRRILTYPVIRPGMKRESIARVHCLYTTTKGRQPGGAKIYPWGCTLSGNGEGGCDHEAQMSPFCVSLLGGLWSRRGLRG